MRNTGPMLSRLRARKEWRFFGVMYRAAPRLAVAWWTLLGLRGLLPALVAVAAGTLVSAVTRSASLVLPLVFVGIVFLLFQVLNPLQQVVGADLGDRTGAWLNDRLLAATTAPDGLAHLERADLNDELSLARDFDLGITGPPLSISVDFIAGGLGELFGGIASAVVLFGFAWWAPIVLGGAWASTHWLLRESGVWRDRNTDEVRRAQRHADYAYRLAVDPPPAKEVRLFGLSDWVVERFATRRRQLYDLQWQATRLREKSVLGCLAIVLGANVVVFWTLAHAASAGTISLAGVVVYLQTAIGTSSIAFGGLNWALDGASAPVPAVLGLAAKMDTIGHLASGGRSAAGLPAREIRFRDVTFAYGDGDGDRHGDGAAHEERHGDGETDAGAAAGERVRPRPVLAGFDLTIPAGSSMAIVGANGAGKTTLAKLLCRLYDPTAGAIEIDGVDLRELDVAAWRSRLAAVFQDFVRYERPLRANVDPAMMSNRRLSNATMSAGTTSAGTTSTGGNGSAAASDERIERALRAAGAADLASLDTIMARGYPGGVDVSGGQWQRIALARALYAVELGAGLVLLDEPTAQLDVRGESEIFERILAATRNCTTILVSHRFSTVRLVDRICVVEDGRVVELGSHDELMALGGRYHRMFELQASRFVEVDDRGEEVVYDSLA